MTNFTRSVVVKATLVLGLVSGLSACSSTELAAPATTNSQTFALASAAPLENAAKFNQEHKARLEAQKKKLAADQQKQKEAAAKRQKLAAEEKLKREAKRLEAFDKMTAALNDQQKLLLKPQRDQISKSVTSAQQEVAKLTPKPRVSSRSGGSAGSGGKYHSLIAKYARQYGVPLKLAHAVVRIESSYRANARGAAGEIGLMQLRPATARMMGYKGSSKGLYHPETNIKYGMKYLGKAHQLAKGSTCGTILKYNAGHGATRMNPISQRYCNRVRRYI